MDTTKRIKNQSDPKTKRCPLCKHRFPIVMLRKHLYRTHTKDRNLLELEKLYEKAIKRKSCTEKIASIASLEDPMTIGKTESKIPLAEAGDKQKKNPSASKEKSDIGKPLEHENKVSSRVSSQSAARYQNGLKKGLLQRAKMQMKKGVLPNIPTTSVLDELPKPIEDNDIWISRNLRTWDKYYASWSDHHYKLVTMDEVNNLFNPNRKTLFVEKKVTSDANGSINTNEKTQTPEVLVSTKPKGAACDIGKSSNGIAAITKAVFTTPQISASPKPTTSKLLSPKLITPRSPSPKLETPKSPSPRPEISVKTLDDLSDMDLHTSEDDEVVEIKVIKRFGYQPDCEDISSDEEWS